MIEVRRSFRGFFFGPAALMAIGVIFAGLVFGSFLFVPVVGADEAVSISEKSDGQLAEPAVASQPAGQSPALSATGGLTSVPMTDKDADHLVPAMAITLRYLFNTLAIAGFVLIVFLGAMRLLRRKVRMARQNQQAEQRQRQLAEANLSRQRAHLLSTLKSLLDIYILVDEDGGCHAIVNNQNDPWWPSEAPAGMTVANLFPADLVPVVKKTISRTLREN
ncbi:MAG: hypothetical protein HQ513_10390, partial [Rhodospirillales bacterium]|nr:hypothetical protein [Rhodospirillales bacterium]